MWSSQSGDCPTRVSLSGFTERYRYGPKDHTVGAFLAVGESSVAKAPHSQSIRGLDIVVVEAGHHLTGRR